MALSDDNDVFVKGEFGVSCVAGTKRGFGLLSEPSQIMADVNVLYTDFPNKYNSLAAKLPNTNTDKNTSTNTTLLYNVLRCLSCNIL